MKNTMKVLGLLAMMVLSACGSNNNGSNNPSVVGPYGYSNCAGCVGNTTLMAQATAQDSLGEALQLSFYGTSGATYTGYAASNYSQVAAQGVLVIQAQNSMSCAVPPGQYQVQSYSAPAVMQGSSIPQLNLVATGPNQVQLQLQVYFSGPSTMQVRGAMMGTGGYTACQLVMY